MRVYSGTKILLWSRSSVVCSRRLSMKHLLWLGIRNNSFPRVSLTDNIGSYIPSMTIKRITLFYSMPNFMKHLGTGYTQNHWSSTKSHWNWTEHTKDTCICKERARKRKRDCTTVIP